MFLNIITPSIRPENLQAISESINIPCGSYRWIVVFDLDEMPEVPDNCEAYLYRDNKSMSGNAQRNFALDLVKEGYIYFNDDDTTIHPDLWYNIKNLDSGHYLDADFIHFMQNEKDKSRRLTSKEVKVNQIDSHNFITKYDIIGEDRWILDKYEADGYFAEKMYSKAKNPLYLPMALSVYNTLR